ncbi:MAG: hypothetical protein ACPG6R_11970 [Aequoribacter sp.]|uniref:hypothetical protein n=1 Tax=Aequoribacter sp. TaxID=2847771 RepID=UPI003C4CF2FD
MDHLRARFYDHAQLNVEESKKLGSQQYDDVLMVELSVKGARGESVSKKVTDKNKDELIAEYPGAWAKYNGEILENDGTDLKVLDFSPARIKELEAVGILSVEDLVNMADASAMKMREGSTMKNAAKKWMDAQELAKHEVTMEAITDMQAQIAQLQEQNKALTKKKPGRPPKVDNAENATAAV